MKKSFVAPNRLTLTVRCEGLAASIDVGLHWLTTQERKFVYGIVRNTQEGGEVGFAVEQNEAGDPVIRLTLPQPKPSKSEPTEAQASAVAAA